MTPTTPTADQRYVPASVGEITSLLASTCDACSRTHFPTVTECPACGGVIHETRLSRGRLSALTEVTAPPPGALIEPPYNVGVTDFAEGIRVIGLVDGDVIVGDEIEVAVFEYHPDRSTFAFRRRIS
ncbi:Zn-ribbon domain-containing OB-fold protein [Rhodococcus sp. NPDC127530]|uniref:Zn-ribbon domain-containing OB-fold protein n=1 Tax=unclassified Rhodococcus (in: high G+C Gram-positive bacteria) TaxID=192944 RepID=UPI00362B05FD